MYHYSCDGQSFGELDVNAIIQRVWANPNATHMVWREGFAQWTPVSSVPDIMSAMEAARQHAIAQQAAQQQAAQQQAAQQQAAQQGSYPQAAPQAGAPTKSPKKNTTLIIVASALGGIVLFIVILAVVFSSGEKKTDAAATSDGTEQTSTAGVTNVSEAKPLDETSVREFFDNWLQAWNNIDGPTYTGCYSADFYGIKRMKSGKSTSYDFKSWVEDRLRMARRATGLRIEAENVAIDIDDPRNATVRFTQYYYSDSYSDMGPKIVKIRSENGTLKIVYEELEYSTEIDYTGADGAPDGWQ